VTDLHLAQPRGIVPAVETLANAMEEVGRGGPFGACTDKPCGLEGPLCRAGPFFTRR